MVIIIKRRSESWTAHLEAKPEVWEQGKTIEQVIGKLILTLSLDTVNQIDCRYEGGTLTFGNALVG